MADREELTEVPLRARKDSPAYNRSQHSCLRIHLFKVDILSKGLSRTTNYLILYGLGNANGLSRQRLYKRVAKLGFE